MTLIEYYQYLVKWLRDYVLSTGAKGVVFGVSGGVDSAVVAAIAKAAFPETSLGVFLPVGDMGTDLKDALAVTKTLNLATQHVDLTTTHAALIAAAKLTNKLAVANSKSRLRMSALYALAQEHNYLVVGTGNAAEWHLGYFTKFGDGAADLLPLIYLRKGEVQALAKLLKLPEVIYTKTPTAALWAGQSLLSEHGYTYETVDAVLRGELVEFEASTKIGRQHEQTAHKRTGAAWPKAFERP